MVPPYQVMPLVWSWSLSLTRIVQTQLLKALHLFVLALRPHLKCMKCRGFQDGLGSYSNHIGQILVLVKIRFHLPQTEEATRRNEWGSGVDPRQLLLVLAEWSVLFTDRPGQRRLSARHSRASFLLSLIPKLLRCVHFLWSLQRMPSNFFLISKLQTYLVSLSTFLKEYIFSFFGLYSRCGGSLLILIENSQGKEERKVPWLMWLNGLITSLWPNRLLVWFPVRAHTWDVGQVPG